MKAALFDLDGVVLDTESQYTRFWEGVGRERFPGVADFALRIKGQTLREILQEWFGTDAAGLRWITERLYAFEEGMEYPYIAGAYAYIRQLRAGGVLTALVTSSDRAKMRRVWRAHPELRALFDCVVTAEDMPRSKPAPDGYLKAMVALGARPEECTIYEDSLNGLEAARRSGARVVGLSTTLSPETLRPHCDAMMADFTTEAPT